MQFVPDNTYTEVSLGDGLIAVFVGKTDRLYSDGLDDNEYICYEPGKGLCYEDGCLLGETVRKARAVLDDLGWCKSHKFFVKKTDVKI